MVGEQVLLSVPSVEVVTREGAATLIREREAASWSRCARTSKACSRPRPADLPPVQQHGPGPCGDRRRAVGGDAADMEDEALAETGNVVLNSCLATMANMLQRPLTDVAAGGHPRRRLALFDLSAKHADGGVVLFLYINFAINDRDIRGYIAMLMDLPSLQALKA
jgi:chemotaxis protein CheC